MGGRGSFLYSARQMCAANGLHGPPQCEIEFLNISKYLCKICQFRIHCNIVFAFVYPSQSLLYSLTYLWEKFWWCIKVKRPVYMGEKWLWGIFDRVLPARSWDMPVQRELAAKIGWCYEELLGTNFNARAKCSWENFSYTFRTSYPLALKLWPNDSS